MDESDNAQIVVSEIYTCKTIYIYIRKKLSS